MSSPSPSRTVAVSDPFQWMPSSDRLNSLAMGHAAEYRSAAPYSHIVIDDFLPVGIADNLLDSFPSPEAAFWQRTNIPQEKKLSVCSETFFPSAIRSVLYALNGATFLSFLERLSGIEGLIPDPYFEGGGIHQSVRGGKLGVHVDFNKSSKLKLDRRLNLLLYLNKEWSDDYGGHLELWDAKKSQCAKKVSPVFNRCVIFTTTNTSYHGHPHPLNCPEATSRKSLALYYYSLNTPNQTRSYVHGTDFLEYPTETSSRARFKFGLRKGIRELTPPIFYRAAKTLLTRLHLI